MPDIITRRRASVAARWDLTDEVVLIYSGSELLIPGRADQTYPFRTHSEYFYLTDLEQPESVLAYDPKEGWTEFHKRLLPEEAMWVGERPVTGEDVAALKPWLERRHGRRIGCLGSVPAGMECDTGFSKELREALIQVRRPKDAVEIDRMRRAAAATRAGFAAIRPMLVPGTTERQVQIEIEAEFFRNGAERTAYDSIVGGGPHSALFHFTPSHRAFGRDELVLIDAGGEFRNYAADVTRTYSTTMFTPLQRDIYDIVLHTETQAIDRCRAGVEYRDIHIGAALDITRGLVDLGLMHGSPESLVEQGAHAIFFPHGIGHSVGLGVRDAGGYMPDRKPSDQFGLRYLRIDLPLETGFTVTIEPGIYFIPVILQNPEFREKHRDAINWEKADTMLDFGGIRIEDNILITDGDPDVITRDIPKSAEFSGGKG